MRKKRKFIILSLAVLAALSIPVGAAVTAQISSERNCGVTDPAMNLNEQELAALFADHSMVFGDYERNFCLGYVDGLKKESLTGNESAEEAERITRKNTLIQEYREYVEALYGQPMTTEEYEVHYQYLMGIYCDELLPREPEPTPEEQLASEVACLWSCLDQYLYDSYAYGEEFIQDYVTDVTELERVVNDLVSLRKKIGAKQLSFEQMKIEYAKCAEIVKKISPYAYETYVTAAFVE